MGFDRWRRLGPVRPGRLPLARAAGALAVLAVLQGWNAWSAPPGSADRELRSPVVRAEFVPPPSGDGPAESLTLADSVVPTLREIPVGGAVLASGWPVAPGERRTVRLSRRETYAPGARVWVAEKAGLRESPRSRLLFFQGEVDGEPETRLMVSVDPESGELSGLSLGWKGTFAFRQAAPGGGARLLVAEVAAFRDAEAPGATWTCGEDEVPQPFGRTSRGALPGPSAAGPAGPLAATLGATVAIDTDNELMLQKFANDATRATNYIAALFQQMNLIYERDTGVRLLQGDTILRPSTTPDPWAQAGTGNADLAKLNEFGAYWFANYAGFSRAAAAMLSGKQGSSNSASGISWLNTLCNKGIPSGGNTAGHYSFSQLFKYAERTEVNDTLIVAHELGHTFSSPHTHCYTAARRPDTCVNFELCYSGATSCPTQATYNGVTTTGTLMSYCHLSGFAGCGSGYVFHPYTTADYLGPAIAAATGNCIFPLATPPTLTTVSPSVGSTAGGTPITLTGTNFSAPATVTVGGAAATSVVVGSPTSITAVTPAGTAGARDVAVTTSGGTATKAGGFTYEAPPAVAYLVPSWGPTAGSTPVTVKGSGFVNGATVTFGSTVRAATRLDASTLTTTSPAHAAGAVAVTVTNPSGLAGTLPNGFLFDDSPPPVVTGAFYPVTPCRIADSRSQAGPLGAPSLSAGGTRVFPVSSSACGIPPQAKAVALNVTVVGPAAAGFLTLYPGTASRPATSSLNFRAGQVRANNAFISLPADGSGTIAVYTNAASSVDVVLDTVGYFR